MHLVQFVRFICSHIRQVPNVLQALGVMHVVPTDPKHCPWLDEFDLQLPVLQTATSST
jgi:hypothetical protein